MQSVSLLTILALLVCPLWCVGGVCHVSGEAAFAEQSPCCCCSHSDGTTSSSQTPGGSAEEGHCQGICGGAVVERASEGAGDNHVSAMLALAFVAQPLEAVPVARFTAWNTDSSDAAMPSGRQLRTRYHSLIC